MSLPKIDNLYSDRVNTGEILKIIGNDYIRMLELEQNVSASIIALHDFFYTDTPKWSIEPVVDNSTGDRISEGVEEEILYQYNKDNQKVFNDNSIVISQAMSSIVLVIEHLEERFLRMEHGRDPVSLLGNNLMNIPDKPPEQKGVGLGQKLQEAFGIFSNHQNTPSVRNQAILNYYREISPAWSLILEYHSTAIARQGVSWSSIMQRDGMDNFLQIMQSQFSYWIEPKLLEAVTLANHIRLQKNKEFADRFVSAIAYSQRQHDKEQSF